jgi:hypothetical protein
VFKLKKLLVFLVILILVASFSSAEDNDGIGLSLGLEFGIVGINKPDEAEDVYPYLMPHVIYDNSFLDGALDIFAELDYTIGFTKVPDKDENEVNYQELYFDLLLGYNLGLGASSTLSFIIENELTFIFAPMFGENAGDQTEGIFWPGVKFNQNLESVGDLFAKIRVPVYYYGDSEADTQTGLAFTAGWGSNIGFGLEATLFTLMAPNDDRGYSGMEILASYENDYFYAEILAEIPKEINDYGVTLSPYFEYYFRNFTFYVYCDFEGIGSEWDVSVSPALGVKFSF